MIGPVNPGDAGVVDVIDASADSLQAFELDDSRLDLK
jgi:hypothetical protein